MDTTTHCSNATAPLISVEEARSLVRTMLATAGGSLALVLCAHWLQGVCGELLVKASLFQLYFN